MNAKTMALVLDRNEQSTRTIAELKRLLQESNNSFMRLHALVGCGHLDKEQTEAAIKTMIAEMASLKEKELERYHIVGSLDDITILPRQQGESYGAYIRRLGQCIATSDSMRGDLARLADSRFSELAELHVKHTKLEDALGKRDAQIAQLEKRESELNELLNDTIESLKGFPMQPEETYSEYLHRMAAEVDQLRTQLDDANRRLLNAQGENQLLTSQRQIVEGELSLHQQVIARLMMQPGTDKVFDLDWNASARKVLIDARAMCGDTAEANVVDKEPQ